MTVEISQHDMDSANLPGGFTFSIHLLEPKTKMLVFFCVVLKKIIYEPNQHFVVLWVGLLGSLFLFSLSYQPGGVYTPFPSTTCLAEFHSLPFPGMGSGRELAVLMLRGGMSARTEGSQIFYSICVCLLLGRKKNPRSLAKLCCAHLLSSKGIC